MRVIQVNARAPERALIREAAEVLRAGGLVAMPTETVYGLAANALDERAVDRIYEAKGRPAINPVIVHVASVAEARKLAAHWPETAERLANTYWPGPLTLVVQKNPVIPDIVTAGGDTVGLRVPGHHVAIALIQAAGVPLAAPSANRSNQVSPTTAQHVIEGLGDRVEVVLDAGPTSIGIESTVVDVTGDVPRILRPGMITTNAIARVAGGVTYTEQPHVDVLRSPGMMARHYAPDARVCLFASHERATALESAAASLRDGRRVGALLMNPEGAPAFTKLMTMPTDPDGYARDLYAALHAMDNSACEDVFVELPPDGPEWAGVLDRLRRGASL
jgi:L-threonylcarbamoyladenylate synthase